jgi:tetraacyldisaccharide-1-P 4'-kinase
MESMNPLQHLYQVGLNFDRARKLRKKIKLSSPVISVGNVSVGGRAKTPFVIALCDFLQSNGYEPVVLTRGYARKNKVDTWLLQKTPLQEISVDDSGDEALEIFLRAAVNVLVSPDRAKQAIDFEDKYPPSVVKKRIFILDDGFQHWVLHRDVDIAIVSDEDFEDSVLPTGRLRENTSSLERADLVLRLNKDIKKKISISLSVQGVDPSTCMALTTRAGSQVTYQQSLSDCLKFSVPLLALPDHLDKEKLHEKLLELGPGVQQLIVGMKEAVKLLSPADLAVVPEDFYNLSVQNRKFEVYVVGLELEWDRNKLESVLKAKGII